MATAKSKKVKPYELQQFQRLLFEQRDLLLWRTYDEVDEDVHEDGDEDDEAQGYPVPADCPRDSHLK